MPGFDGSDGEKVGSCRRESRDSASSAPPVRGRRESGRSPEGRREMTLRCEARGRRDICQGLLRGGDQRPGALDSTPFDERAGGCTRRRPEGARKVMKAESGAAGEIAKVDRTLDVRLDEHLNPLQCGRRQAAALVAFPRCRRLAEPLPQVDEVPLLNLARGSENTQDEREVVRREGGEHLSATVPQRLPDAIDPLARVRRQFDLWSGSAGRSTRVARHLQPGDNVAEDIEREAERLGQALRSCSAFEQQQRHAGQVLLVETQDRRRDLIDGFRRFLKPHDLDANLLRQRPH
jgi:hypothetical protein